MPFRFVISLLVISGQEVAGGASLSWRRHAAATGKSTTPADVAATPLLSPIIPPAATSCPG